MPGRTRSTRRSGVTEETAAIALVPDNEDRPNLHRVRERMPFSMLDRVPLDRLLVAVDGSEDARQALRVSLDLAARANARLSLVSVVPHAPGFERHPAESGPFLEVLRADAHGVLDEAERAAKEAGVSTDSSMLEGYPADEIVTLVERARPDLAIVGSRGLSKQRVHLVGSVGYNVVQFSPVPVLVARSAVAPRRVVVAVDGSSAAARAAAWAARLAKLAGSEGRVSVLYVIPQDPDDVKFTVTRAIGQPFVTPIADDIKAAGVPVERRVEYGRPADAILRVAREREADAIVLGRVGAAGPATYALGGVTDKVLHRGEGVSLLVVP